MPVQVKVLCAQTKLIEKNQALRLLAVLLLTCLSSILVHLPRRRQLPGLPQQAPAAPLRCPRRKQSSK